MIRGAPGSNMWRAQALERLGRWESAANVWASIGETSEARVCRAVDRAVSIGDAWRARVRGLVAGGLQFEDAARQATDEQRQQYGFGERGGAP